MTNTITEIQNGVALVKFSNSTEHALAEVDARYVKIGDEIPERELTYNGGDPRYDGLFDRFNGLV